MNYQNVPTVIFSHPPLGVIGLSAADAISKYGNERVKVYSSKFVNMHYSMIPPTGPDHRPQSMFKLVTSLESDGRTERVVGAQGMGRGIDEMMQGLSIAMNMGATK